MTYPPQQPGPYGPQDPYGQQPRYGQQQQPRYGQQQPQYGPPSTPWAGQQPGYPMGPPPPPKKKTGLVVTLVIVGLLAVGGGVTTFVLLNKDDTHSSKGNGGNGGSKGAPRETADTYVDTLQTALNTELPEVDLAPLKSLACTEDYTKLSDALEDAREESASSTNPPDDPEQTKLEITDFEGDDKGAKFTMTRQRGDDEADPLAMKVLEEDGGWRVCGLYDSTSGDNGNDGTEEPPTSGTQGEIPNPIPTATSR